ncbi:MAG: 2-C-methyl-D-erythritol 4-phosphate cytidylyltransferase [Proteobacteria bacterium]|nr:2-C-methyl-D-erythritol 4-phosphate cytidylyltransferase [Pseudomonadota bacterium]
MGAPQTKAFIPLKRIPILAHTIRPFEACSRIQSIYLVLRDQDIPSWQQRIVDKFSFTKTKPPVAGGSRRQDSVRLGLEAIKQDIDIVLIHDGARPFIDTAILERLLETMKEFQAAVVAVPAKETIKVVSSKGRVLETPTREGLWHIQTPQAFDYRLILDAHRQALTDGVVATDDSTLIERLDVPVAVVQGSYRNIKITTPEDLLIARTLLENRGTPSFDS